MNIFPCLFFFQLLDSTVYGERKGAAYGLSGLVKGLGILYLKQLNIMSTLQEAIQDKKNYRHREGALFAYEMLCSMLGRLFEPYVVHVLPNLLLCFGDGNQYVREVREEALNWCCILKTSASVFFLISKRAKTEESIKMNRWGGFQIHVVYVTTSLQAYLP